MPVNLALAIRSIVQLGVTLAIYTTAEAFIKAGMPLLVALLTKIFGLTEQEAKDFLHDFMIDQAAAFGLTVVALRKQMPTIVSEYLGFTSKGFSKLGFAPAVKKKIETTISKVAPAGLTSGWGAWSPVMKIMGGITAIFMLTQSIEVFAYRPRFFTNILSFIGLGKVSEKILIPPPTALFSNLEITQYANSLKISEDEMRGLLEAATEVVRGQVKVPTQANVIKVIREDLLKQKDEPKQTAEVSRAFTAPKIRVFTGIVSQGVIGAPIAFTPRQDDLIENIQELEDAAHNNEAPFLASLPGRVIREIKIVSSITTKDGFTQRGTATQVISGYNKSGTPKYRTVVNKFAVADMFLLSEKGNRTKISRIVYGPVDSIRFQPVRGDISALEATLKTSGVTSDPADLTQVISGGQLTMLPEISDLALPLSAPDAPLAVPIAVTPRDYFVNYDAFFDQVFYISGNSIVASPNFATLLTPEEKKPLQNYGEQISEGIKKIEARGVPVNSYTHKIFAGEIDGRAAPQINTNSFEEFFGPGDGTVAPATGGALPAAALNAGTLYDFYTAQGQPLPSVAQRAPLYESLGLGQKAYYTGTAEQNLKLLAKLQGK